jgi:Tuberculosis necrotizing toxin
MQIKNIFSLLPLIAVAVASPLAQTQNPPTTKAVLSDANTTQCPNYCSGTAYNSSLTQTYVCGDARLGPLLLPTGIVLGDLVDTYKRFGNLCPGQFLAKWYNSTAGSYIYPPQAGFQLNTNNSPIEGNITLPVGFQIDRFGSEYGTYTSPRGAPYNQRALPPSNLDTPQSSPLYVYYFMKSGKGTDMMNSLRYPYNYHVYTVTKPFEVISGPIAGWFEQPGQGVQYEMSSDVMDLVAGGFLERVQLT